MYTLFMGYINILLKISYNHTFLCFYYLAQIISLLWNFFFLDKYTATNQIYILYKLCIINLIFTIYHSLKYSSSNILPDLYENVYCSTPVALGIINFEYLC